MTKPHSGPTPRQREYLIFIKSFTERWGVPPSFDEIGRHFQTTAPSVNNMIKTLEAKGFLSRVPRAPRTLRVLVPDDALREDKPHADSARAKTDKVQTATEVASMVLERLIPVLRGAEFGVRNDAIGSVFAALDVALRAAGASEEERSRADETLLRISSIAQGDSTETRPGRQQPWWRQMRPR